MDGDVSGPWIDVMFGRVGYRVPDTIKGSDGKTYTVQEQIGTGGNAVVCECADETDGTVYAVKFLTNSRDKTRLPRFELEAKLMEQVSHAQHDHLIRFVCGGQASATYFDNKRRLHIPFGIPFLVMERAKSSLRELIKTSRDPISPEIYAAQFRGLVGALETLHLHAIHRDIKPDNILVVGERWLISDFGLCSMVIPNEGPDLTEHWRIPGPRFWMSPEANNRSVGLPDEVGAASDVFQLAAVFWWVVNGRHPSGVLTREDWSGLDGLFDPIFKALQHSLTRRFASAQEFGAAVAAAISG